MAEKRGNNDLLHSNLKNKQSKKYIYIEVT